jgi:two-component system, NtrC family, sensor histidine kinase HydH
MSTLPGETPRQVEPGGSPHLPLVRTLRFRLIISIALVHALLMGVFVWHALSTESGRLVADTEDRADALTILLAAATTNAVLTEDLASLAEVVARVGDHPDVTHAEILDRRDYVLASTAAERVGRPAVERSARPPADERLTLRLGEPIEIAGNVVGQVRLEMSMAQVHRLLTARRNQGLLFILFAVVIGGVVAWLISLHITRDLHAMTMAASRVGQGDLSVRVHANGRDEIGHLASGFNRMVASLEAISDQARQEHAKRLEAERLAYAGHLAAHMAHEIRNPLSAVINSVRLLNRPDFAPQDRSQLVEIIDGETQRLQRILQSFLDSARTRDLRLETADVSNLVEEVVHLASRDSDTGERIRVNLDFHRRPCVVVHDPDQLRQVLWNLVLNAMQAMPQGGDLSISTVPAGDRVRFTVGDSGGGFPPRLLSFATEPFYTGRRNGIGLGLVIVQRILSQHGTPMEIDSREGVGTTISFELEAG